MVAPAPGSDTHVSRRDRRTKRSRARWRKGALIAATTAVIVAFGLVITETVRFDGGAAPSLAGTVSTPAGVRAAVGTTLPGRSCRAPLTDAEPLRLWIGGDSLAGSLGPALGEVSGATGVVQPQFDSRVASGLTSPGFFNWPDHAVKETARLDPEIAVFIIGANDFAAPLNTTADTTGQPAWKATYTQRIEDMLRALGPESRTVIWIGSPAFKDDRTSQIKQLDDLMSDVIAKHTNVVYVDAFTLFTDADGKYAASLPPVDNPDGDPVLLRAGDGVHFTPQGGERLAKTVFQIIDAQCKVTEQAVPGVVKAVKQTEGSTQVVASGRDGSVQTSPPASAAPTTTTAPVAAAPSTTTTVAPTTTDAPTTTTTTVTSSP